MQVQSCLEHKIGIPAMFAAMTSVADDIRLVQELIAWTGTNANQVASKIGKPNTTINRFANGKAQYRLARDTLTALQKAFPDFPGFADNDDLPDVNARPFRMEGASEQRMRQDLPIYGTALGAAREVEGEAIEQTTLNRAEVLQYAKRPVILDGNASAYGLYVSGSSMEPRHMDGEIILADPKARIRAGDDVVVYLRPENGELDDGETARGVLVKRLVRRTATHVELEQYRPAKVFKIANDDVVRIDRVLPWSELLS